MYTLPRILSGRRYTFLASIPLILYALCAAEIPKGRCGQKGFPHIPCFDNTVRDAIEAEVGETAGLPCIIHNVNFSNTVISWWKEGDMSEISLGTHVSDNRYKLSRSRYNDWTLSISEVELEDAGNYICQINLSKLKEKFFRLIIKDTYKPRPPIPTVDHEFVKDEAIRLPRRNTVTLTGDNYGYMGQSLSLSCKAYFKTNAAQSSVEWYHGNRRQESDPRRHIDITMRWERNNTMYSVLTIGRLRLQHAGNWRCLKVSPNEPQDSASVNIDIRRFPQLEVVDPSPVASLVKNGGKKNSASSLYRQHHCTLYSLLLSSFVFLSIIRDHCFRLLILTS